MQHIPLELFVFVGSFIEELLSPIPSAVILVPAGVSVQAQGISAWYIAVLALIAGIARVPAALLLYWLASALGTKLFSKRAVWFGVKRADVARLRAKLGKRQSWWALFTMWAVPVFPGFAISLAGGFIKLPLLIFTTATFFGSIINALIYLYLGYLGLRAVSALQTLELAGQVVTICLIVLAALWSLRLYQRSRRT